MNPAKRQEIFTRLRAANPYPTTELEYSTPFELLVAVVLSAQATDVSVNAATRHLFPVANTPQAMLDLGEEKLRAYVQRIGLYQTKSKHIIGMCRLLLEKHGGQVPQTMDDLISLPGVWRKTANIVLGNAFGITEGIAVDTHVTRVANRMGLADSEKQDEIEQQLCRALPKEKWTLVTHLLIFHGRTICKAQRPECPRCPVRHLCPWPDKNA